MHNVQWDWRNVEIKMIVDFAKKDTNSSGEHICHEEGGTQVGI